MKSRHGIVIPTTFFIGIVVRKQISISELCLLNVTFRYQYYKKYCIFFSSTFYHFKYFSILEGYIVRFTNYDYDKYFSMAAWGKLGGSCDEQVKLRYQKNEKK